MTTIKVEQDDIKKGKREDCQYCAVALALRRQTGMIWEVDYDSAINEDCETMQLPAHVADFIEAFDRGESVQPFEFEVTIP